MFKTNMFLPKNLLQDLVMGSMDGKGQEKLFEHFKIWGTLGVAQMAASIPSTNELASTFAYLCGGIASLAIAWWHIFKK